MSEDREILELIQMFLLNPSEQWLSLFLMPLIVPHVMLTCPPKTNYFIANS